MVYIVWVGVGGEKRKRVVGPRGNKGGKKTYIKAPPYLGAPKLARAMSQPVGYLALASGGKVTWGEKPWQGERGF